MTPEFEKWAVEVAALPIDRSRDGTYYQSYKTCHAWDGWQASRKAALEDAANKCMELHSLSGYDYGVGEWCADEIREMMEE